MQKIMLLAYFFALSSQVLASEEIPQSFTLDGRFYSDTLATTPLADVISLKIQVLNPSQNCILFEETQSVNTTSTAGYYTIQIGQKMGPPAGKRSSGDSNNALTAIFSNSVSNIPGKLLSDGTTACSYNPTAGDLRYLKFTMTPAGDNIPRTTTSNLRIDSVPMALVAERAENLRGLTPSQLLQVNGTTASLTQANLENVFSTLNYPNLVTLLGTAPTNYVLKNSNGSTNIPSVAGSPGSGLAAGQIWYDSTSNQLKYYDGAVKVVGSSSAGVLAATAGGTGQSGFTAGDILFANSTTTLSRLPAAANGLVLTSNGVGAAPSWQAAGGSGALSSLTAATSTNSIDNANLAQTWNWNSATTETPLSLTSNALTTGTLLGVSTSSAALNSTNGLLNVANTSAATTGILARFQSNSTAGSGLTILNNGRVGVGTSNPGTPLDVVGSIRSSSIVFSDGGSGQFSYTGAGNNQTTGNTFFTLRSNNTERMRIDGAGNVGIGMTNPSQALDVNGIIQGYGINLAGGGPSTYASSSVTVPIPSGNLINAVNNGGGAGADGILAGIRFTPMNGSGVNQRAYIGGLTTAGASSFTPAIVFGQQTGNIAFNERMRIDASGNVGIGTTSASAKLSVDSGTAITGTVAITMFSTAVIGTGTNFLTSVQAGQVLIIDGQGYSVLSVTDDTHLTLAGGFGAMSTASGVQPKKISVGVNDGNFGIGTTLPLSKLEVISNLAKDTTGTVTNGNFSLTIQPAVNSSATYYGINSAVRWVQGLNSTGQMVAGNFSAYNALAPVSSDYRGINSNVTNASGTMTSAYGGYFGVTNSSGTITNSYGVYTSTIQGTNKYSFYASDTTAPSYFAGKVGIGTTVPSQMLSVAGTIESTSGGYKFPDGTTQSTAAASAKRALLAINGATSATGVTAVSWNLATYDTGSFWSAGAPTRLTIPAGVTLVRLCANAYGYFSTGSGQIGFALAKGGSMVAGGFYTLTEGHNNLIPYLTNGCSSPLIVTTGDYFELQFGPNNAGTVTIPNDPRTWLSIEEVR